MSSKERSKAPTFGIEKQLTTKELNLYTFTVRLANCLIKNIHIYYLSMYVVCTHQVYAHDVFMYMSCLCKEHLTC